MERGLGFQRIVPWGFSLLILLSGWCYAIDAPQSSFSQEAIAQMVAPIALYPDPLLSQVLMASTYPIEVVSAARWLQENSNLKGQALEDALQQQNWDPSVKSLTEVPDILNMMNEKLDMTINLGNAFLDQQNQVLDAIQSLRARAKAAGYLNSGKEQVIDTDSNYITIALTDPDTLYVPIYDPNVVYGSWPYPDDLPYSYYPLGYTLGSGLAFAGGLFVGNVLWGTFDWRDHSLGINLDRYNAFNHANINNARWDHDPAHREGVLYHNADSQRKYGQSQMQAIQSREAFRGHSQELLDPRQHPSQVSRREESQYRSNAFEGIKQGEQVRQFSDRGTSSLGRGDERAFRHEGGRGGGGGGFHGGGRR